MFVKHFFKLFLFIILHGCLSHPRQFWQIFRIICCEMQRAACSECSCLPISLPFLPLPQRLNCLHAIYQHYPFLETTSVLMAKNTSDDAQKIPWIGFYPPFYVLSALHLKHPGTEFLQAYSFLQLPVPYAAQFKFPNSARLWTDNAMCRTLFPLRQNP